MTNGNDVDAVDPSIGAGALLADQRQAFERDGFVRLRGFVPPATGDAMLERVIELARRAAAGEDIAPAFVLPEQQDELAARDGGEVRPEDLVSKVFRLARDPVFHEFAVSTAVTDLVADLLGPADLDVFLSQFIFKNPGAWGQPWHQDSYYFPFEPARPVARRVAGHHRGQRCATAACTCSPARTASRSHDHVDDRRPNANYGYVEIVDHDMGASVPVLMDPGDLLLFDSHLMHRSTDNETDGVRAAMVFHYARHGTVDRTTDLKGYTVNDWIPARRAAARGDRLRNRWSRRPTPPPPRFPDDRARHPRPQRLLHVVGPTRPLPGHHRRAGSGLRRRGRLRARGRVRPGHPRCGPGRDRSRRGRRSRSELRQLDGGKLFIARADAITFTTHLVARSAVLRDLVSSPPLTDLCADLIGPDVRLYWDQAVYKKHDADATFPWHQDNGYAFVEPQQYLTCWIALTDATEDNGCPQVVPGIHRTGTLSHRLTDAGYVCLDDPPGAVTVPARAGDIVVFSSLTPHCTGPNLTDGVRKAYIVQYAPDGAAVVARADDGALTRTPAVDPRRQFPVLVGGERVPPR